MHRVWKVRVRARVRVRVRVMPREDPPCASSMGGRPISLNGTFLAQLVASRAQYTYDI